MTAEKENYDGQRKVRCFLGAPVSDELAGPLMASVETSLDHLPPLRMTPRENLHLTLIFMGSIAEQVLHNELIPQITELLREAKPGRIHFRQVTGFPSTDAPKHLVLEGHGSPSTESLRESLNEGLAELKPTPAKEYKAWRPHITLGRFREHHARAVQPTPWQADLPVGSVVLYESETTLYGPVYLVRHQWSL